MAASELILRIEIEHLACERWTWRETLVERGLALLAVMHCLIAGPLAGP